MCGTLLLVNLRACYYVVIVELSLLSGVLDHFDQKLYANLMTIYILEYSLQSLALLGKFSKLGFYHVSLKLILSQANKNLF